MVPSRMKLEEEHRQRELEKEREREREKERERREKSKRAHRVSPSHHTLPEHLGEFFSSILSICIY